MQGDKNSFMGEQKIIALFIINSATNGGEQIYSNSSSKSNLVFRGSDIDCNKHCQDFVSGEVEA
jgi:hypothetical protein